MPLDKRDLTDGLRDLARDTTRDLNRRHFLQTAAALGASAGMLATLARVASASASTTAAGAAFAKPTVDGIGLQLYTVGDQMRTDFDGTIEKVANIGYKQVEFAGYNNKKAEEVRALLDRLKLKSPSSHIGMDLLRKDLEGQAQYALTVGHEYITIPSLGRTDTPMNTVDAWKRIADECNTMGAALKQKGLKLAFHSHTAEYVDVGGGKTGLDVFVMNTDPAVFNFQMDLGWARVASQDPVAWFKKYPGRFKMWHVKDIESLKVAQERETASLEKLAKEQPRPATPPAPPAMAAGGTAGTPPAAGANAGARGRGAGTPPAPQPGRPAPVGTGDVDFKPILAAWKESGMQYFFIEQDGAGAWPGGSLASVATSYQNLKKLIG